MSNQSDLDEEGLKLYNDYIKARNKWINYIRPKAIQKLNIYIDEKQKNYYKYEYLNHKYNTASTTMNSNQIQDKETQAKFKKLSLLFHPDKFNNLLATEFFILIKDFYSKNNEIIINTINDIAHEILELNDLQVLINNLSNSSIMDSLNHYNKLKFTSKEIFTPLDI